MSSTRQSKTSNHDYKDDDNNGQRDHDHDNNNDNNNNNNNNNVISDHYINFDVHHHYYHFYNSSNDNYVATHRFGNIQNAVPICPAGNIPSTIDNTIGVIVERIATPPPANSNEARVQELVTAQNLAKLAFQVALGAGAAIIGTTTSPAIIAALAAWRAYCQKRASLKKHALLLAHGAGF
ncbi:hypothetical protein H2202_005410 [Exophiala xenobiotica]|nr:hypothetical protein H2202_005410 [Exophiala xenobiotica]